MDLEILDSNEIETGFYLRFTVKDDVGIVYKITGILAKYNINIDMVSQNTYINKETGELVFVMTIEKTRKSFINKAVVEINNFDFIRKQTFILKILD